MVTSLFARFRSLSRCLAGAEESESRPMRTRVKEKWDARLCKKPWPLYLGWEDGSVANYKILKRKLTFDL